MTLSASAQDVSSETNEVTDPEVVAYASHLSESINMPVAYFKKEQAEQELPKYFRPIEKFGVQAPFKGLQFFGVELYRANKSGVANANVRFIGAKYKTILFETGKQGLRQFQDTGVMVEGHNWIGLVGFRARF